MLTYISKSGRPSTHKIWRQPSSSLEPHPFKGKKGASNYFKDVTFAIMRSQLGALNLAQFRYINPWTTDIGNKNAQKTIVYLHGGGYVLPGNAGQMKFLIDMKDACIDAGRDTAILFLAYTTAPEAKYPTQLTYRLITLGGDSADGNLATGVSFNTYIHSFQANAEKDAFDGRVLRLWSAAFLSSDSPFAGDFYSEPVTAPTSFWEGVAGVVDEIEEFMARFQKGFGGAGGKVTTIATERAAHEEMILDVMFGYKEKGKSHLVLENWVKSRL
ncbi:uncharacterized protein BDZ99DRAFT_512225 [Mytilinidion resinicola]|uniref:Alpha/beta-hydrolase n=1 Tax=Mytilinidion resinicola TaxID=574789 RepID=A0A6A6Y379_9PEZI|nr:uncharacterized protein BDZ99DRAFT_512225 [Mytilinidion resinicola]KAF2803120.1 hypothetical protein BDZ99DRAFT_512225 [Mytilinidion resinicola]